MDNTVQHTGGLADDELEELLPPEPEEPPDPVAPVAAIRDCASASVVQVTLVPALLTRGKARQLQECQDAIHQQIPGRLTQYHRRNL